MTPSRRPIYSFIMRTPEEKRKRQKALIRNNSWKLPKFM